MSTTTILTREDERIVVVSGDRFVNVRREYMVRFSSPPRWKVDPEAGICIEREHMPAFIAALQAPSPAVGNASKGDE